VVDFNNEATIGTPASEVVKILILQRRYDMMEALEQYNKLQNQDQEADISVARARLFSLFLEIQAMLKRRLTKEEYDDLFSQVESSNKNQIMKAIYSINEQMDKISLTKIDTKRVYDTTRVEKENKIKGL
jgi:hypothetical protein